MDDLARWTRALRDPALGIDALLARLESGAPAGDAVEGFAFGVYPRTDAGMRMRTYHGVGEYVWLTRLPEAELSVVTLCNAYDGTWTFGPSVARLFAGPAEPPRAPSATSEAVVAAAAAAPGEPVPAAELQRWAGEYRTPDGRPAGVRVDVVDGAMRVTGPDGRTFAARTLGGGRFEFVVAPGVAIRLAFTAADSVPGGAVMAQQLVATGEPAGPVLHRWVAVQPTADELRSYAGTYVGDDVEVTLHVTVDGDQALMATRGLGATAMTPIGADTFEIPGYVVRFHRDAAGTVGHLTLDAPRVQGMRYSRIDGPGGDDAPAAVPLSSRRSGA